MAADDAVLLAEFRIKDFGTSVLAKVEKATTAFGDKAKGVFNGLVGPIKHFATELVAPIASLVTLGETIHRISEGAREFLKTDEVLRLASARIGGNLEALRAEVDAVALAFGDSSDRVATALRDVAAKGAKNAADAFTLLRESERLAIADGAQQSTVLDLLIRKFNAYGEAVSKSGVQTTSDMTLSTARLGRTALQPLAEALDSIIPKAASLNVRYEEMLAAIAALTAQGRPVNDSVNALNRLFQQMAPLIGREGLAGALAHLHDESGASIEGLRALGLETRDISGIAALAGDEYQTFLEILDKLRSSGGATGRAFEEQMTAPIRQFGILVEGARQGFEELGARVITNLLDIEDGFGGADSAAQALKESIEQLGPALETILVGFTTFLAGLQTTFFALRTVIFAVRDAMGEVTEEERKSFKEAGEALAKLLEANNKLVKGLFETAEAGHAAAEGIGETVVQASGAAPKLQRATSGLDAFRAEIDQLFDALSEQGIGRAAAGGVFGIITGSVDELSDRLVEGRGKFSDFARDVGAMIAKLIVKLALLRTIGAFFPGLTAANTTGATTAGQAERGGVVYRPLIGNQPVSRGFAEALARHAIPIRGYERGGIADEPQIAVFGRHGRTQAEAFVPLGGDRRIPVKIQGEGRPAKTEVHVGGITLVSQSIDPRGAADVMLAQIDKLEQALAERLHAGVNRSHVDAVRNVARRRG